MTNDQIVLVIFLLGSQAFVTINMLKEAIFKRKWHLYLMCVPFSMYVLLVIISLVAIWEKIDKIMNFNKIKQEFKKLK